MADVFVSYRTQDTLYAAADLTERLGVVFGPGRVFRDAQSLLPGRSWSQELERALAQAQVLVLLIGPGWLDTPAADGSGRAIDDADDWVRHEVRTAFAREIPVVPVLFDDTPRPRRADLPDELAPLAELQALRIRHEHLKAGVGRLTDVLVAHVPALLEAEPAEPTGQAEPSVPPSDERHAGSHARPIQRRLTSLRVVALSSGLALLASTPLFWFRSQDPGAPVTATSVLPSVGAPPPRSARLVAVYDNYATEGTVGHAMCLGNENRAESMPGGMVTQTFAVPDGVGAISAATVQIDPQPDTVAHAVLSAKGRSTTANGVPDGDTDFTFDRLPVLPGETVTLTVSFSARAEGTNKLITVYSLGHPGGTFQIHNACRDGAESLNDGPGSVDLPIVGLRARVVGDTG